MKFKDCKYKVEDITEKGEVTIAIAGIGNLDSDKDVIHKGAFKRTFNSGANRVKHVYQHDITNILGLPLKMYETDDYAIAVSQLNLEKQFVRDVHSDYKFFAKHNRTYEHSIGFIPVKYEENKQGGIDISELKLFEYSTVTLGANSNTPLLGMKGLKIEDLENFLREDHFVSDEKGFYIEQTIKAIKALQEDSSEDTLRNIFKQDSQVSTLEGEIDNYLKELKKWKTN